MPTNVLHIHSAGGTLYDIDTTQPDHPRIHSVWQESPGLIKARMAEHMILCPDCGTAMDAQRPGWDKQS